MTIDLTPIENLNNIITNNSCFQKKIKKINKTKKNAGYTYQYYNQLCTCIIRIRETTQYLSEFKFNKENICGQAFDFYEFINCAAIIEGCSKVLFKIFNVDLNKVYPSEKAFKISNKTRQNDLAFFSFIRSAASMHPAETNAHNKITKHKFEVYPYAIWCNDKSYDLINTRPNETNIELLSWNCKTKGKYKYYYLVIDEFFDFIKNILVSIKSLIPVAENIVKNYKETIKCKRLKKIEEFDDKSMYCLYLREKIQKKLKNNICPDGGLLLASHILKKPINRNKI